MGIFNKIKKLFKKKEDLEEELNKKKSLADQERKESFSNTNK